MIFNLIKRFFKKEIDSMLFEREFVIRNEISASREEIKLYELTQFIGKPVIVVSNEWDTPIVGMGVRIEYITAGNCPVLIVKNYVDRKEYMVFGVLFAYSSQKLRAIFKLDPFELCSLLYYKYVHSEFNKEVRHNVLGIEEVVTLITSNGFFDQFDTNEVE